MLCNPGRQAGTALPRWPGEMAMTLAHRCCCELKFYEGGIIDCADEYASSRHGCFSLYKQKGVGSVGSVGSICKGVCFK